jgi:hypothetical protein
MIETGELELAEAIRNQPIGRLGTADEIAAAVLWFCSPGAGFVVGVALPATSADLGRVSPETEPTFDSTTSEVSDGGSRGSRCVRAGVASGVPPLRSRALTLRRTQTRPSAFLKR